MNEYPKIPSIYKRDMTSRKRPLLEGQWIYPEFEYLAGNVWTWTEKVDGTNIRVMFRHGRIEFAGRTDNTQIPAQLVNRLNEKFLPLSDKFLKLIGPTGCLYGEGYGNGIQKTGAWYRADQDFVLFDVKIGGFWLDRQGVEDVASNLGIDVVPIIGEGTLYEAVELVKKRFLSKWGVWPFCAEGLIARPKADLYDRFGLRIITKIKYRDFPPAKCA